MRGPLSQASSPAYAPTRTPTRPVPLAPLLALAFAVLPLAGCIGGSAPATPLGLFALQPIVRGDPEPVPVGGCDDVLDALRERALLEARVSLERSVESFAHGEWYGRPVAVDYAMADDDVVYEMAASAPGDGAGTRDIGDAQATGTNNQETGADEGDLVKTDGEWTYVLSDGVLHVLHSAWVGELEEVARVEFGAPTYPPGELLLDPRDPSTDRDDRLVVLLPGGSEADGGWDGRSIQDSWDEAYYYAPVPSSTRIVVLDLADRQRPMVAQETEIDGTLAGARLVGGTAYAIVHKDAPVLPLQRWVELDYTSNSGLGIPVEDTPAAQAIRLQRARELAFEADRANQEILDGLALEDQLPAITRRQGGLEATLPVDETLCRDVLATPDGTGRGVTTILAIATSDEALPASTTQVLGSHPIVYASEEALVLAAPSQDAWWLWQQPTLEEATDLQWFGLDGLDVRPRASGRVPGIVRDSFGLDVHDGTLRVISAVGAWGTPVGDLPVGSLVAVYDELGGLLVPRGFVPGIAPGEQLWSARFTDGRAYLVTFRQTDPLWVIDLEADVPKLVGELQIPGVSTYLHPLDDDTLLAIGYGPGPDGRNLDWGSVEVSLFDISDLEEPRRADVLTFNPDEGEATSSALAEHKAFTYWPEVGTLAVPMTTNVYRMAEDGSSIYDPHVGLSLVLVDPDGLRLSLRGEVDQDALLRGDGWGPDIQRSYFVGFPDGGPVSVVTVSPLGVASHDLWTQQPQDAVAF